MRKYLSYTLIAALCLMACTAQANTKIAKTHEKILETDEEYMGVTLPSGTKIRFYDDDPSLIFAWLGRDATIHDILVLMGSEVEISDPQLPVVPPGSSNNIQSSTGWSINNTRPGQKIMGIEVPENSRMVMQGSIPYSIDFSAPVSVQNLDVKYMVYFYKNGNLKQAHLAHNQVIDNIPFYGSMDLHPVDEIDVKFFHNGKVAAGILSKAARLLAHKEGESDKMIDLKEGDSVRFDEQERVTGFMSAQFVQSTEYTESPLQVFLPWE